MFDYQTVKLLHRHGTNDYAPMVEGTDHTSTTHDPERAWLRGARLFRCTTCEDEVILAPEGELPSIDPDPGK
jgi:hypothetical protein